MAISSSLQVAECWEVIEPSYGIETFTHLYMNKYDHLGSFLNICKAAGLDGNY